MSSVTGSCMCGLVSYTMSAEPLLSAICHCRDCQKQTGTSFSLVLGIPRDSFKITGDLSTYETIGMSGSKVMRKFCGNCGSPMYSDADAFEGLLFVKSGTLDDPRDWFQLWKFFVMMPRNGVSLRFNLIVWLKIHQQLDGFRISLVSLCSPRDMIQFKNIL